jgi:single-strand DNA-binding protein
MSLNNVSLVGRLTRDAELKYTAQGRAVATFTLAVNRSFKNPQGQYEADFINIVLWGKPAEALSQHTQKGSMIAITGRIQTRNYENNQGQRVYVTEVVADSFSFVESKNQQNTTAGNSANPQTAPQTNGTVPFYEQGMEEPMDIPDDDLPF